MSRKTLLLGLAVLLPAAPAHAFGIVDNVSAGLQVGAKVVGAAVDAGIDKVKESMRDPEEEARKKAEEERKIAAAFQKQVEQIEARTDLRPIDKEKLILALREQQEWARQMQAFVEQAEARQKAERDKIFTTGGFLSVVGEAALNTPSMAMARAEAMTRNPLWRQEQRARNNAVFAQADAQVKAGVPQAQARAVLAQADSLRQTDTDHAMLRMTTDAAQQTAQENAPAQEAAPQDMAQTIRDDLASGADGQIAAASPGIDKTPSAAGEAETATQPDDAFSPDLGKPIWIEFEDAPGETAKLRQRLQERGHTLAATKDEAEVVYLIQGEFSIPETKLHEGITKSLGGLLENPSQIIDPPAKKMSGAISAGIASFLLAASGANAKVPAQQGYSQQALLVIARQPKGGKETRFAVKDKTQAESIEAASLAIKTRDRLYQALGV